MCLFVRIFDDDDDGKHSLTLFNDCCSADVHVLILQNWVIFSFQFARWQHSVDCRTHRRCMTDNSHRKYLCSLVVNE